MIESVAIVTGASRGIGKAIACALGERGWRVVINYHSNAGAAQASAATVQASGGDALVVQANVASTQDRDRLLTEVLDKYGRIDLLVNNAGMAPRQRLDILETSEESYDEVMVVNLKGPFFLTQAVVNQMLRLKREGTITNPKIINIGSLSAYTSSPNRAEYCLSKAGMTMMTTLFADRLADAGILVYEIRPGIIETDMTSVVHDKYERLIADGLTPIRRWGSPEDVAQAVVALVSDAFPFSTGEIINVDGGFHLRRL